MELFRIFGWFLQIRTIDTCMLLISVIVPRFRSRWRELGEPTDCRLYSSSVRSLQNVHSFSCDQTLRPAAQIKWNFKREKQKLRELKWLFPAVNVTFRQIVQGTIRCWFRLEVSREIVWRVLELCNWIVAFNGNDIRQYFSRYLLHRLASVFHKDASQLSLGHFMHYIFLLRVGLESWR